MTVWKQGCEPQSAKELIKGWLSEVEDPIAFIEKLREALHELSPLKEMPIDHVRWVPIEKVRANDYNPNAVAPVEMKLLYVSIKNDGYTQPIVTVYDEDRDEYVIVDGFHRYSVACRYEDIAEATHGFLPIVVIEKDINDRMASTVRHNRARGKHSVASMSKIVFDMLANGWSDPDICNELGMEPQELLRLKHITGFSKLFANLEYREAWETRQMIQLRKKNKKGKEG